MNYGKGLTTIRTGLGMDTIDFSDLLNLTPGTVFKYEENHEDITLKESVELCKQLKIPLDFFLGLSMEVKDVPMQHQFVFAQVVEKLTNVTVMVIRAENLDGEKIDVKRVNDILDEVKTILMNHV